MGEQRVGGKLTRIGLTTKMEDSEYEAVVPQPFVEQDGVRIVLSDSMVRLIALHHEYREKVTVVDGAIVYPDDFDAAKRAAITGAR